MRKLSFIIVSILAFCGSLIAQTEDCPQISMSGPMGMPNPGDTIPFTVQVDTKGKDLKLEYVWSISAGEIISGQGTNAISVKVSGDSITTTVEIKGLPDGCPKVASETGYGCGPVPRPELIESFSGPITAKDKARIEKLRSAMWDDPNARYMFFVAGKDNRQIRANIELIVKYLRPPEIGLTFVHLAENSIVTQFWRIPPGADDPKVSADGLTIKP